MAVPVQQHGQQRAARGRVLGESLQVGVDDKLPVWQYVVYGFQMLIADGLTALVLPIVLGRALHLSTGQTATLLSASLLAAGLVTIGQSVFMLKMPVLQGPAIIFLALVPLGAVSYGLDAMWTAMWIGGLLIALLSWPIKLLPRMRHFIAQPAVYGVFLVLVAFAIAQALFTQITGPQGSKFYGANANYLIAVIPFAVAFLMTTFLPRSKWRTIILLLGGALSVAVAAAFGQADFSSVGDAPWFRVPHFMPFGFHFRIEAVLLVFACYFINLFEGIGVYKVFTEDIAGQKLTDDRVAGGIFTEGLGSAIGGVFGGMGATTYAQNLGSIAVTRVGTRFQVTAAGCILVFAAFLGKFGTAMASLPGPVVGGLLFTTVALLLMQGLRVAASVSDHPSGLYAVGAGILVGAGWQTIPATVFQGVPNTAKPFVTSPLIVGLVVAVVIYFFFGFLRERNQEISEGDVGLAAAPDAAAPDAAGSTGGTGQHNVSRIERPSGRHRPDGFGQ